MKKIISLIFIFLLIGFVYGEDTSWDNNQEILSEIVKTEKIREFLLKNDKKNFDNISDNSPFRITITYEELEIELNESNSTRYKFESIK